MFQTKVVEKIKIYFIWCLFFKSRIL